MTDQRRSEPPANDLSGIGRQLTSAAIAWSPHLGSLLALGVVVVYSLGIFRTLASLQTIDIPPVRALTLAPLQTYFVRGLGVLVSTSTLVFVLALALLYFGSQSFGDLADRVFPLREDGPPNGPQRRRWWSWVLMTIAVVLVIAAVTVWLPLAGVAVVAALVVTQQFALSKTREWRMQAAERAGDRDKTFRKLTALVTVPCLGVYLVALAWIDPPPVDRIQFRTDSGHVVRGDLITQADGLLYFVQDLPPGEPTPTPRSITGVPIGHLRVVQVRPGEKVRGKSLAEILGWRRWGWRSGLPSGSEGRFRSRKAKSVGQGAQREVRRQELRRVAAGLGDLHHSRAYARE